MKKKIGEWLFKKIVLKLGYVPDNCIRLREPIIFEKVTYKIKSYAIEMRLGYKNKITIECEEVGLND